MPDAVDMEIVPPRDSPTHNSPRAAADEWHPVPVEPPSIRRPSGSLASPASPIARIARKPVGSPPSRSGTFNGSPPLSLDAWEKEAFASLTRGVSGPGGYPAGMAGEYESLALYTVGHGRSGSNGSLGHARNGSDLPTPGPVRYGSTPSTPARFRSGSNTPIAGHFRSGSNQSLAGSPRPQRAGPSDSPPTATAPPGYYPPGYHPLAPPAAPSPIVIADPPNRLLRYWLPHYSMYFFLLVGILFAVGHHLFYRSLHGQDATNQIRLLRYGAVFSFLCKASLAAAAVTAFRQRVWMTVRRKVLTLAAVDSLFAATEDLPSLFNLELFRQAKLAILLALYVWCTPLVVIFASDTLVVEPTTVVENTTCPSVRSFNFAHEGTNDWRVPHAIDGMYELSLSYWNNTSPDVEDDHFFDYYSMASQQLEQVATLSAYLKMPIMRDDAAKEVCSQGWNCTFTIDFIAPGYKCTELAKGVGSRPRTLSGAEAPFGTDVLAPTGNLTYIAQAYEGEYSSQQIESKEGGVPVKKPPYPRDLGALRTEPVIWVGYAAVDDPSQPQPETHDDPRWDTAFTPRIFGCEHHETRYLVDFTYNSSLQHTHVRKREYLGRIIDTTLARGRVADDGTLDNTTATPRANYVRPTDDVERYRTVAAYHSLGAQLRGFVNGTITEPKKIVRTRVTQTRLMDMHSYLAVPNLETVLPTLYEDMLLSLLSNPQFLAVAWAADTSRVSGTALGGEDTRYPCTRHRTTNRYRYHAADLWAVYTVAVLLCILAVSYGTYAVLDEGVTRTTRFSAIAAATRGPALEKVPWEAAGGEEVTGGAGRVRVGYGVVVSKGSSGFGVEGDVVQGGNRRRWGFSRRGGEEAEGSRI